MGAVPSRKAASIAIGAGFVAEQVAGLVDLDDFNALGREKSWVSEYCGSSTAFFMNSAQMGAAACAPSILISV